MCLNSYHNFIKSITTEDIPQYYELVKEFYSSDAVLHPVSSSNFIKSAQKAIEGSPYIRIYLFKENEKIFGYSTISLTYSQEAGGMVVLLEEIFVKPDYRGKGVLNLFLDFLDQSLKDLDIVRYRLEVAPKNQALISKYTKLGFTNLDYIQMVKDT